MTSVKEQFMQILPQIQKNIARMSDSDVQQLVNLWFTVKPGDTEESSERILGISDGKYKYPDDINAYDDEIAELFGV